MKTNKLKKIKSHLFLITKHKWYVGKMCFRCGLYKQGLLHDLSKYTLSELLVGFKYYDGEISPNAKQRKNIGYSSAWLHHKGRNKHHYEYWIDCSDAGVVCAEMPKKYIVEMFIDRVCATMIYQGDKFNVSSPYEYFLKTKEKMMMNVKVSIY